MFLQLAGEKDDVGENKYDLSLLTATGGGAQGGGKDDKIKSQLNKVISLIIISDHVFDVKLLMFRWCS